jgi:hypothetical protein
MTPVARTRAGAMTTMTLLTHERESSRWKGCRINRQMISLQQLRSSENREYLGNKETVTKLGGEASGPLQDDKSQPKPVHSQLSVHANKKSENADMEVQGILRIIPSNRVP